MDFFTSPSGRIIISIIWGLGIAALFRKICQGPDCVVIQGPDPNIIREKTFKIGDKKCVQFTPYYVDCT